MIIIMLPLILDHVCRSAVDDVSPPGLSCCVATGEVKCPSSVDGAATSRHGTGSGLVRINIIRHPHMVTCSYNDGDTDHDHAHLQKQVCAPSCPVCDRQL